ncbi:unnamed protein product [Schistosoma curassoni]|uniref:Histone acetyltransferase n=1 Tax=Schistosoma curassoni TaxID=6186 RepID=A0A183JXN9_9TREM|nr:unnamed protein product [Schistosoma curassoni]
MVHNPTDDIDLKVSTLDPDIQIGEVYKVLRSTGQYYPAAVIEGRIDGNGNKEYYVHYCNHDRRLDEWVTSERIDCSAKLKIPCESSLNQLTDSAGCDVRFTRNQKRKLEETSKVLQESDSLDSTTQKLELEYQEFTRVKFIDQIQFGKYEIDTWYFSPYPEEFRQVKKLWICEYCLKYMKYSETWLNHIKYDCKAKRPPGKEIYNHGNLCVFELDGNVQKEKVSADNYNLACILTLPPFQRRGYGHFLISLSYELAKIEQIVGTPEKPLSDLGRLSYRSYWEKVILNFLLENPNCTMNELSTKTCIAIDDIIWTLQYHPIINNWQHGHQICLHRDTIQQYLNQLNDEHSMKAFRTDGKEQRKNRKLMHKNSFVLDINRLKWDPPIKSSQNNKESQM